MRSVINDLTRQVEFQALWNLSAVDLTHGG
jgi:hypothetical protein